jgi:polysaccharide biosynthesis protein PslG
MGFKSTSRNLEMIAALFIAAASVCACGGASNPDDLAATRLDETAARPTEEAAKRQKTVLQSTSVGTASTTTTATTPTTTVVAAAPAPAPAPAPVTATGRVVPASFFGMHYSSAQYQPWPAVGFRTLRTWDQWPGVAWANLHTARGVYNWTQLDIVVNAAVGHGADIVYTFGYTPLWAAASSTSAPTNMQDWRDFVAAITARYAGRIKYWELWNEPNAGNFWSGSNAQMLAMAQAAYPIIKAAGGTVLSPAPQGNSTAWMDAYLSAGGAAYLDIISFHGYLVGPPEGIVGLADGYKAVANKHGLGAKPIWDTEHSWGDATWPFGANQDQQAAWLARFIPLSFSKGVVERSFWYLYDSYQGQAQWGPLFDATSKQFSKPGIAYREVYNWMVNAAMEPCTLSNSIYQCRITRSGGYEGLIIWAASSNPSYTASYAAPTKYVRYKTLDATLVAISPGASLTLGMKPILLETQQ